MAELVHDTRFEKFIDLVRDHRERAVMDACLDVTVKCPRASMAAIGEIRAYTSIIEAYDDFLDQPPPQDDEIPTGN